MQSLLHQSIKLGAGLAETYINMNEFRYTGREEFIKSVEKIILSTSKSKKITTEKKNLVKSLQDLVNEHLKKTSESRSSKGDRQYRSSRRRSGCLNAGLYGHPRAEYCRSSGIRITKL